MTLFVRAPLVTILLGLVVCSIPTASSQKPRPSRFAGNYSGKWIGTTTRGEQKGEWIVSIDPDGKIKGTEKDETVQGVAKLTGSITEEGDITFTLQYPEAGYKVEGTVTKTKDGSLKATLIQYNRDKTLFAGYRVQLAPLREAIPRERPEHR
jgi:hypothetical protein